MRLSIILFSVGVTLVSAKLGNELQELQESLIRRHPQAAKLMKQLEQCDQNDLTNCAISLLEQFGDVEPGVLKSIEQMGRVAEVAQAKAKYCKTTDDEQQCKTRVQSGSIPKLVIFAKSIIERLKKAYPSAKGMDEVRKLEEILASYDENNEEYPESFQDSLTESIRGIENRMRELAI